MKKTTVKPISLGYRDVGSNGAYTPLMGVLKGLTIGQDDPDSTEIEAEFYDVPFDIFYDGNPVTMSFELANYDLAELEPLFGGTYDATNNVYDGAVKAFTSEHEWKLEFQRGNAYLIISRGLTIGTLKKDEDGALNYNVTITALIYDNGTTESMYKIGGAGANTFTEVDDPTGNPKALGYYERTGTDPNFQYRLTWDTEVVEGKTYYTKA